MKTHVTYFLINAAVIAGLWWMFPRTEVVQVFEQKEIDENVWVRRASVASDRTMIRELREENEKLANALDNQNDEIASLTRMVGRLNLERDELAEELEEAQIEMAVVNGAVADTSFTINRYFGNELFRVQNVTTFNDNIFTSELTLYQERDIKIDVATTINRNEGIVMVYVSSDDFVELNYTTQTSLTARRWHWYHYAAAGFLLGGTTALILN